MCILQKILTPASITKTERKVKSKNTTEQTYSQVMERTLLISEKVSSKSQSSGTSASEIRTDSNVNSAPRSSVSDKTRQNVSSINTARDESLVNSVISTTSIFSEEASHTKSPTNYITTAVDSSVNQTHLSNPFDSTVPEFGQAELDNSTGIMFSVNNILKTMTQIIVLKLDFFMHAIWPHFSCISVREINII